MLVARWFITLLLVALPAAAQPADPLLRIQARSILPDGSSSGATGSTEAFEIGTPVVHYIYAGDVARSASLCVLGGAEVRSGKTVEGLRKDYAHVWSIKVTPVKYDAGRETFDLEWARYSANSPAVPAVTRRSRLTLDEGQRLTIDLVQAPAEVPGCTVTSINVEVEALATEKLELADTLLRYEIWLVGQDADGQKTTHHLITSGLQGLLVPFGFAPIRRDLPKLVSDQFDFEILSRVSGQIRGRLRDDGRVVLDMRTRRTDESVRRGADPRGIDIGGGEGRKVFDVAPGETVEIPLPARKGMSSTVATPAAEHSKGQTGLVTGRLGTAVARPAEPLSIANGRLVVDYARFFEGQSVSLMVQARRID